MFNSSFLTQNYDITQIEQDDDYGTFALDQLITKLQKADLIENPRQSKKQQFFTISKIRNKSQTYPIYSSNKQPTSYSLYRKQMNLQHNNASFDLFSNQTLETVKDNISFQYSKILKAPFIIKQSNYFSKKNEQENIVSLLQSIKQRKSKEFQNPSKTQTQFQLTLKILRKPQKISEIIQKNQAVKNLQRKVKNSRRNMISKLNQSYSFNSKDLNYGFDYNSQSRTVKTTSTNTNSLY